MGFVRDIGPVFLLQTASISDVPAQLVQSQPFLIETAHENAKQGESAPSLQLTAAQLFQLADSARDAGDYVTAETAYRALAGNPDIELRSEARFRLAMMLADQMKRTRDAAVELRRILDEKPDAARVRLELARMDAMMGRLGAAEREMRAAQASGQLPADVERAVRFYAAALAAAKPLGGSLELALAPDSNINRATRADTLGTVIGDFTLSDDAKAKSGLGLAARAQGYLRVPLSAGARLLARVSGSADFYRSGQFDDYALAVQFGPEFQSGADRITFSGGPSWRWYGQAAFSQGWGALRYSSTPWASDRRCVPKRLSRASTIAATTCRIQRSMPARSGSIVPSARALAAGCNCG